MSAAATEVARLQALADHAGSPEVVDELRRIADLASALLRVYAVRGVPDPEAARLVIEWLPRVLIAGDRP